VTLTAGNPPRPVRDRRPDRRRRHGRGLSRAPGSFDVTPDGERFLLLLFASLAEGSIRLNVISNWQAGLPN